MAFAADLRQEVLDAILPEVKQKGHEAGFAILKSLFPAQDQLYLTLFAHL